MINAEGLQLEKLRCAEAHAAQHADPAGSAPHWDAVMAVEIPAPWPRDISACEPFSSVMDEVAPTMRGADGRTWRPQGLHCDQGRDWIRMIAFERSGGPTGPFARREWRLPAEDKQRPVELAASLLAADSGAIAEHDQWRDDPGEQTVDLLVCTHGTRDVCCGGPGTALYAEVVGALGGADTVASGSRRRVWRTSHAGGHRFAPTALSFPEGVSWAHLGAGECRSILERKGDLAGLAPHWRGALSVEPGIAQVGDREGFAAFGWDWSARERTAVLVSHDRASLRSMVEVTAHSGGNGASTSRVTVEVEPDRHIPVPTCGVVDAPEFATEVVWKVTGVQSEVSDS